MKLKKFSAAILSIALAGPALAAEHAAPGTDAAKVEAAFRMPQIIKPADVDALLHLSKEEKAFGKMMLRKIPDSHGWFILGNDPELQALYHLEERVVTALLEGDFQAVPFGPMHLSALEVSRQGESEYVHGLFALLTARQIEAFDLPQDAISKIALSHDPDAAVWNDEERLILQFTQGVISGGKMSDELFAEIREKWGEQRMLRLFTWINFVDKWSRMSNMLNMGFTLDMVPSHMKLPPEMIDSLVVPLMKETQEQFLDFIKNDLSEFPGSH